MYLSFRLAHRRTLYFTGELYFCLALSPLNRTILSTPKESFLHRSLTTDSTTTSYAATTDFPTTSSAARNQRRPAGGRPRLPPAEPGCGVTPNQNDPGSGRGGFDPPKGSTLNAPSPGNTGVVGKRERPLVAGRSVPTALLARWEGEVQKSM